MTVTEWWQGEIPELDTDKRLQASLFLEEIGVGANADRAVIAVELARARHALDIQHSLLAEALKQTAKYKGLLRIERELTNDTLEENIKLQEVNEMLEKEVNLNVRGMDEITRRLDAAVDVLMDYVQATDWEGLFFNE